MNKRAILYGLIYCLFVIFFKLAIIFTGNALSTFGFYYSNLVGVLLIIPFLFLTVKHARDRDFNGSIGGRDAARIGLTVVAVAMLVLTIYHYFEFRLVYHDLAVDYYNGKEYREMLSQQHLKNPDKIRVEDFDRIITEQVNGLSAFKAATGKLIPLLFFGITGAFMTSVFLRRQITTN